MALVLLDRVRETTLSTGTGTITLAGAVAGYQPFSAIGNGNDTYYTIYDTTSNDWEVGIGSYTLSGNTLSRTIVLSSSNGGSLVPFAAGSKEVFVTYPAEKAIYEEVNGDTIINAGPITVLGTGTGNPTAYPDTLGRFYGNQPSYQQVYVQNQSSDSEASADLVAYNDLGDGLTYFIDMGVSSSNYSSATYPIFTPNSGYIFNDGGELIIGSSTAHDVILFAGGVDTTDEAIRIDSTTKSSTFANDITVTGDIAATGGTFTAPVTTTSTSVTSPANNEFVTKSYVDNATSTGIHIHTPVYAETSAALAAVYVQGGTTFNITDITGGNTVVTSTTHGLSVNDQIWLTTTAGNGLSINTPYFVYATPTGTSLQLSLTYGGVLLTGLTNASGLSYATRANSGVGSYLESSANATFTIGSLTLTVGDRILVYQQSTGYWDGVYTITSLGSGSTKWKLTRATDQDRYAPQDTNGLGEGDYFLVTTNSESYVLTTSGPIIIGYTPLTYTLFSSAPVYTGGTNIDITGGVISLTGTVAATNGGTGTNTVTTGDLLYGSATDTWSKLPLGSAHRALVVNGSGTQVEWNAIALNEANAVSGTLPATKGGTGINSFATGDLIYSSATNTLTVLPGNTSTTKKFLNQTGTGSASQAPSWDTISSGDVSGLGTMSTQNANSVAITGGSIDNTTVGATTPTTGKFTSLGLTGAVSGTTTFQAASTTTSTTYTLPAADGTASYVLQTDGSGTLSWGTGFPATPSVRGVVYGETGASFNTVLGLADAGTSTGATDNVAIGEGAQADLTSGGGYSVAIGSSANSTTGGVAIGYAAGAGGGNSIAIGSAAAVYSGSTSNSIVIGAISNTNTANTTVIGNGISATSAGVYIGNIGNGTGSTSGYGTLKYDATSKKVVYDTTSSSGATITNDTTTSTAVYPVFADATSGSFSTAYTSNSRLLYTPSTGTLAASSLSASNGVILTAQVTSISTTVPTGYNGMSIGPWSVAPGQTFTLASGSRHAVV